jgi:hypothetical protein
VAVKADRSCVCGHPREAHEHYRAGSDCALCGKSGCPRFRVAGGLRARLTRLLGQPFAGRAPGSTAVSS